MVDAGWTDISWTNALHPKRGDHILISGRTALQPKWAARKVVATPGWKVRIEPALGGSDTILVQQVRKICRSHEEADAAAKKINSAIKEYQADSTERHRRVKREIEDLVGRTVFRSSVKDGSE